MRLVKRLQFYPAISTFVLGVLAATGFAPLYWWPVSLLCLAVFLKLLFSLENPPFKKVAYFGWLFGFGFSLASLWWMGAAFRFTALGWWALAAAPFAMVALAAVMGLWYAAVFALAHKLKPYVPLFILPAVIALLWVAMEAVRALGIYGLPWHLLGYIFAGNLYLIQPAAFGQVFLLSFLAVLLAAALALTPRKTAAIYVVLALCVFGAGILRLNTAPPLAKKADASLYQTSIPQDIKWHTTPYQLALKTFAALKKSPAEAELIIFPETVFTFLKQAEPELAGLIGKSAPEGAGVVFGIPSFEDGQYLNTSMSVSADGRQIGSFSKQLLVPFGEFIPLQSFMPAFLKKFAPANAYSAGQGKRLLETSVGQALPIICYEVIFPYHLKKAENDHHPEFILNLTNDGWFAGTTGPHQHFAIARLRSVETGLTQVRATNKGVSGFIDGYGRVIKRLEVRQSGFLSGSIFVQVKTPSISKKYF